MSSNGGTAAAPAKPRKSKSREVTSRFLSSTTSSTEYPNQSPKNTLSTLQQNHRSSTDSRIQKSLDNSGFLRGLWPASSTQSPSPKSNSNSKTLAYHLGNDRKKDLEEHKSHQNTDHRTPFSKNFNGEKKILRIQNRIPIFGGAMGKSSNYTKLMDGDIDYDHITPGRFSMDDNKLRKKSSRLSDSDTQDSESEYSDIYPGRTSFDTLVSRKHSYMAPTLSTSRKHGIEIVSKFMQDSSSRPRRSSADSGFNNHQNPVSISDNIHNSPKNPTLKNAMKNSKPVGNILSMGIGLLKGKRSNGPNATGSIESVHQLKLLHNRLMQWRYSNGRTEAVNGNIIKQVQINLLYAWNGLSKLQQSVLQKKIQLQREKLEMKLNYILQSQIKVLEIWENMERQHLLAVSSTKDYLNYVVCRIPLLDGAKVEPHLAYVVMRHASDLVSSINLMLTTFSYTNDTNTPHGLIKTVRELAELAIVVTQEKLLLQECLEIFRTISTLEIQERSLKSNVLQLKLMQKKYHVLFDD